MFVQDMKSNVYALDLETGRVIWRRLFRVHEPRPERPRGKRRPRVCATDAGAFALDTADGRLPSGGACSSPKPHDNRHGSQVRRRARLREHDRASSPRPRRPVSRSTPAADRSAGSTPHQRPLVSWRRPAAAEPSIRRASRDPTKCSGASRTRIRTAAPLRTRTAERSPAAHSTPPRCRPSRPPRAGSSGTTR